MDWPKHVKIRIAAAKIAAGGVIAYPTEAVWGLGCDPFNRDAVLRLLALKQRAADKGLLLIAAAAAQVAPLLHNLTTQQRQLFSQEQPHPTTWLVPETELTPSWIRGRFDSVAIRVTRHPVAAALCQVFGGPIVSTSANPSARPPAVTALTVRRYFPSGLAAITPGKIGDADKPSEIRHIVTGAVVRAG